MRVLGVDPGLTRCGLGVVDALPGRRVGMVDVGVARSHPDEDLARRLLAVGDVVEAWLDRHEPDAVALERVFAQHNLRTVMGTAQVSGVVMVAAARRGIPVATHTPSEVKAAVTGYGTAPKRQVAEMVRSVLGLDAPPAPADAADALALAICHLWRPVVSGVRGQSRDGMTSTQRAWALAEVAARRRPRRSGPLLP